MKLKDELQRLRTAAHSLDAAGDPRDCVALILRGNPYDLMFFSELSDARWLGPLREAAVFSNPPRISTRGTITYYPRHTPLIGLQKLAQIAPVDVATILESLDIPDNPQVHDQVMRIIAAIDDVSFAPKLVQILEKLFRSRSSSEWIWLDDILTKWLERGARQSCLDALRAWFEAIASDVADQRNREEWQVSKIDREIISRLVESHRWEVARLMFDVLRSWAQTERTRLASDPAAQSDKRAEDPDYDYPWTYWLEQFGVSFTGLHDFENTLAQRLYSIGRAIFESEQSEEIGKFDEMVRGDRWHLFRRMRWQLYADFPAPTLQFARRDVIERIPRLGQVAARHGYEFASMLESQVKHHGSAFLNSQEVSAFADAVFNEPIEKEISEEDLRYRETFQYRQIYPIRELLKGEALQKFADLSANRPALRADTYKPFSSGGSEAKAIEHVSPKKSSDLARMSNAELWTFLNNWIPSRTNWDQTKWWVEEDIGALGNEFADLIESQPSRFLPEGAWWRNIQRPEILYKPLDRAATRLEKAGANVEVAEPPTASEWKNWFGIARSITERRSTAQSAESGDAPDWNWPSIIVVKFLRTVLRFEDPTTENLRPDIAALLRKLIEDPDPRLAEVEKPWMSDWLTTAINSVRGTAIEALLELALAEKQDKRIENPESWIFELIAARLRLLDESPAVFAILGARLRLAIHLFYDQFKSEPELLLPTDRSDHRASMLNAHIRYENPMSAIIEVLPNLPSAALDCLEQITGDSQSDRRSEFGSRLGSHLSFYYWNAAFHDESSANAILDRFFEIGKSEVRAMTIGQIARIFAGSQPVAEHAELYNRVMKLWDRRFSRVEAAIDSRHDRAEFYEELSEFVDWLQCECFTFDWRIDRTLKAIACMDKAPKGYTLIETLNRFASSPETLDKAVEVLHAVVSKPASEIQWSYREEHLKSLLEKGLAARNPSTVRLAEETQEKLLREGFFEYLEIGSTEVRQ